MLVVVLALLSGCKEKRTWGPAPGMKSLRPLAVSLEGIWIGHPWGELVVSKVGRDSLMAAAGEGLRIRGAINGSRADIVIAGDPVHPSGYLYLLPATDSLFVGLRDSTGGWDRFFTLYRQSLEPVGGEHS